MIKQLTSSEIASTVLHGIMSRLHIDYPEVYARYLKRWHPEDYEAYKLTAAAQQKQSLRNSHAGYTRLEVLGFIAVLLAYLLAGSIGPTHWTPNGTVAEGSNYHSF